MRVACQAYDRSSYRDQYQRPATVSIRCRCDLDVGVVDSPAIGIFGLWGPARAPVDRLPADASVGPDLQITKPSMCVRFKKPFQQSFQHGVRASRRVPFVCCKSKCACSRRPERALGRGQHSSLLKSSPRTMVPEKGGMSVSTPCFEADNPPQIRPHTVLDPPGEPERVLLSDSITRTPGRRFRDVPSLGQIVIGERACSAAGRQIPLFLIQATWSLGRFGEKPPPSVQYVARMAPPLICTYIYIL